LGQELLDLVLPGLGVLRGLVTRDDLAAAVDDEIGEIPLDATSATGNGVDHPIVQVKARLAIDVDLVHHVERDTILLFDVCLDLLVSAGLLAAELIAWEGDDGEPIGLVLLEHRLQLWIVVLGVASFGRYVDDDGDATVVLGEID
jgi:hypothetical protein